MLNRKIDRVNYLLWYKSSQVAQYQDIRREILIYWLFVMIQAAEPLPSDRDDSRVTLAQFWSSHHPRGHP